MGRDEKAAGLWMKSRRIAVSCSQRSSRAGVPLGFPSQSCDNALGERLREGSADRMGRLSMTDNIQLEGFASSRQTNVA